MARIRTIKPEFFTSEDIVELSPFARLLYIALWCEADRAGRMQWKPRTFKMRYLPADDVDVVALCDEIVAAGLIVLYGDGFAHIPKFDKHQHINPREAASTLPDPDACSTRDDACSTREERDSDGACTVSDAQVGREGKGREGVPNADALGVAGLSSADPCPHQQIIAIYHETLPNCIPVKVWNEQRQGLLRQRWREDQKRQRIEWWKRFFAYVGESEFLTGRGATPPDRDPFVVDLEWLIRPKNFAKVIEGKYHRQEVSA